MRLEELSVSSVHTSDLSEDLSSTETSDTEVDEKISKKIVDENINKRKEDEKLKRKRARNRKYISDDDDGDDAEHEGMSPIVSKLKRK